MALGLKETFRAKAGEHRCIVGNVDVLGYRSFSAASLYLESGKPLQGDSAEVFAQLGEHLNATKREFIIGGDFNSVPNVIERS